MGTESEKGRYTQPEGSKTWEYMAILTSALLAGCIGFVVGWNSPSIVILMAKDSTIPVSPPEASTLVATVTVGHMVAPPINTFIVDKIGRRNTLLLSNLPLLISWAMVMIATTIWELYVARLLAGIGLGLFICVGPMYMGEISSPDTRGAGTSLVGIVFNVGIFVTFIVAPHLSLSLMAGIFLMINICFVMAFWFMPESPYFLVMRNRTEEAEEVLEKLRGKTDVSDELQMIVDSLSKKEREVSKMVVLKDVFTSRGNLRALLIISLFVVTHHFGGFHTILAFGRLIFESTNNVISNYMVNVIIGIMQVVSSFMTTFLVDRLGRKPLILGSGIVAAICNLVIGVFFYAQEYLKVDVQMYTWALLISSIMLVFAFNCGLMCLQIVLMSEIFSTEIKAISTCLVGIIGGLLGTLGTKLYVWIAISLNYGHSPPFLGYFVIVAVCTIAIFRITPETKGKTLIEIQKELNKQ